MWDITSACLPACDIVALDHMAGLPSPSLTDSPGCQALVYLGDGTLRRVLGGLLRSPGHWIPETEQ